MAIERTMKIEPEPIRITDLIGERALLKLGTGRWGAETVEEYMIVEVSPSGKWVRIRNVHGNRFWRPVSEVNFVEKLQRVR